MGQVFSERETRSLRRERRSPLFLSERKGLLSAWGKVFLRERRGLLLEREGVFSQSGGRFSLRVEGCSSQRGERERERRQRDVFCNLSFHQKTRKMKGTSACLTDLCRTCRMQSKHKQTHFPCSRLTPSLPCRVVYPTTTLAPRAIRGLPQSNPRIAPQSLLQSQKCASPFVHNQSADCFHNNPRIALHPKITSFINRFIFSLDEPEQTEIAKMISSDILMPKHHHMTVFLH